jgi:hypothetical protein
MGIGSSIFLIAAGAILYFAVNADVSGLDISTVGLILMVCGWGEPDGACEMRHTRRPRRRRLEYLPRTGRRYARNPARRTPAALP